MPNPGLLTGDAGDVPASPWMMIFRSPEDRIYFISSADGQLWDYHNAWYVTDVNGQFLLTKHTPAVCLFNGTYFMVYVNDDDMNSLQITQSANGFAWADPQPVSNGNLYGPGDWWKGAFSSKAAPALAASGDILVLTYQANDTDDNLYTTWSTDGIEWSRPTLTTDDWPSAGSVALLFNPSA